MKFTKKAKIIVYIISTIFLCIVTPYLFQKFSDYLLFSNIMLFLYFIYCLKSKENIFYPVNWFSCILIAVFSNRLYSTSRCKELLESAKTYLSALILRINQLLMQLKIGTLGWIIVTCILASFLFAFFKNREYFQERSQQRRRNRVRKPSHTQVSNSDKEKTSNNSDNDIPPKTNIPPETILNDVDKSDLDDKNSIFFTRNFILAFVLFGFIAGFPLF